MSIVELLVLATAVWRISSLFVAEVGPFNAFLRLREAVGIEHDYDYRISVVPDTLAAGVLSCMYCFSVWCGTVVAIAAYFAADWTFWLMMPFALSGCAIMLETMIARQK